jgi:hypothetical protein
MKLNKQPREASKSNLYSIFPLEVLFSKNNKQKGICYFYSLPGIKTSSKFTPLNINSRNCGFSAKKICNFGWIGLCYKT